jgi:hypothetical protein
VAAVAGKIIRSVIAKTGRPRVHDVERKASAKEKKNPTALYSSKMEAGAT